MSTYSAQTYHHTHFHPKLDFGDNNTRLLTAMAMMTAENTKSSVESLEKSAKKQSKWSAEEDAVIIDSRGKRMQWHEISKLLPGRSATSCVTAVR